MIQYLVFVAAIIQIITAIPYIKGTLRGETKPNRVTWLMWSIAPMIATPAALYAGAGLAVLPIFMSGFIPFLIFISSFVNKNSYWKLEIFDYFCGAFSLLALILWAITQQTAIAVIFAGLSDGAAAIPTLVKMWKYPETEKVTPFFGGLFNALTSFAAIRVFNVSTVAFQIYLVLVNVALISSFYRKKIFNE